ncbi:MAG: type II secretion system protein GspH [Methylococcaceae bacterium]|nr:type II secretion system protein GspH [Methylococcaceae bacterium]
MRSNAGFTLLELIVVLAIVALGYGAVAVNFSAGNDDMALKAVARDLTSGLRYVRSQAMLSHKTATLDFNLSNNSYSLTGQKKIYTLPENIDVTINTAKDELHDGVAQLRFFPDGSSIGGRVTLEKKSHIQKININWLTGHVTLTE